jgi:hypothetical protein
MRNQRSLVRAACVPVWLEAVLAVDAVTCHCGRHDEAQLDQDHVRRLIEGA